MSQDRRERGGNKTEGNKKSVKAIIVSAYG